MDDNPLDAAAGTAERRMIMATEFNTQVGNGEYRLQFETEARRCVDGGQMTNADRIRSMSDEVNITK